MDEEYLKRLIIARLKTIPPNVSFSVGSHGDFTIKEIISHVKKGTEIGKEFIEIELKTLITGPKILSWLGEKKTSSH